MRARVAVLRVSLLVLATLFPFRGGAAQTLDERTATAVEALSRLPSVDLETNPKIKQAVLKVLAATRGHPEFVRLVKRFNLTNQHEGLLEFAVKHPAAEDGVEAARLLLQQNQTNFLQQTLANTNDTSTALLEALSRTGEKTAAPYLLQAITNATSLTSALRMAVRSFAQHIEGAHTLLNLAQHDQLPEPVKLTVASELHQARWPEIKDRAATVLPLPATLNAEPLPPLSQLTTRTGDPLRGARIFRSETAGCAKCHQVRGEGTEIGPNLSEIGSKLGKEALYESILNPSAGISFGYEAWQLELDSGEEAYGVLVSETADELAIKDLTGTVTRYKKSAVTDRRKTQLSLMPTGLQQSMSVQDLVDLVEYLVSLKKDF